VIAADREHPAVPRPAPRACARDEAPACGCTRCSSRSPTLSTKRTIRIIQSASALLRRSKSAGGETAREGIPRRAHAQVPRYFERVLAGNRGWVAGRRISYADAIAVPGRGGVALCVPKAMKSLEPATRGKVRARAAAATRSWQRESPGGAGSSDFIALGNA